MNLTSPFRKHPILCKPAQAPPDIFIANCGAPKAVVHAAVKSGKTAAFQVKKAKRLVKCSVIKSKIKMRSYWKKTQRE
jgi:hypothetical protein